VIRLDVGEEQPDAIGATYDRYRNQLLGLATLLAGSRNVAEEVVHDVFAAAIPRWDSIDNHEWYLKRSVVNRVRSLGRREIRSKAVSRMCERVTGEPLIDEAWRLLRRLPVRQRTVLVLRIHLDLPDEEIARLMDCPESTVRSLAFRALESLRKELA
jgi:RNA polymerase sigma factor (sigma-70 family)